ncbi:MAG TPA: hypothetical protein VGG83_11330 [Trebonia sp.]
MSESSNIPAGEGHPFDVERFARETIQAIEFDNDIRSVFEDRITRIEECIAARRPRRWLLWARLRREMRASVATRDEQCIPRNDFRGRRYEWTEQEIARRNNWRTRHHADDPEQTKGWQRHTGWDSTEQPPEAEPPGDTDPGVGFLS